MPYNCLLRQLAGLRAGNVVIRLHVATRFFSSFHFDVWSCAQLSYQLPLHSDGQVADFGRQVAF